MKDMPSFRGRVKSRLFRYLGGPSDMDTEPACAINIVVEETDGDWGMLVKE